jgi:hypothetical protein
MPIGTVPTPSGTVRICETPELKYVTASKSTPVLTTLNDGSTGL